MNFQCDFGDAYVNEKEDYYINDIDCSFFDPKTGTFCGTPLYVSPEMLEKSLTSPGCDLWALGVIIY